MIVIPNKHSSFSSKRKISNQCWFLDNTPTLDTASKTNNNTRLRHKIGKLMRSPSQPEHPPKSGRGIVFTEKLMTLPGSAPESVLRRGCHWVPFSVPLAPLNFLYGSLCYFVCFTTFVVVILYKSI